MESPSLNPMTSLKQIQLVAEKAHIKLTPEKKRFNTLSKQIAKARKTQLNWVNQLPQFHSECDKTLGPARKKYVKFKREIVFGMGRILDQVKLNQETREELTECLISTIQFMVERSPIDEELRALFDKHSSLSFDEFSKAEAEFAQSFVSAFTAQSVEDKQENESHEEFMSRMHEQLQEQIANEKQKRKAKRSAKDRSEDTTLTPKKQEELVAQNLLKDVFRKLVSALHPDREKDPSARERKTQQMQEVNRAYKNNELLTLLQLQFEIEQIDESDLHELAAEQLNSYNKLLSAQLKKVREETQEQMDQFCAGNNLPRLKADVIKPEDLNAVIHHVENAIYDEVEVLADEVEFLYGVKKSTRQLQVWIHHQMALLDGDLEEEV